jgi:hypothetical protein
MRACPPCISADGVACDARAQRLITSVEFPAKGVHRSMLREPRSLEGPLPLAPDSVDHDDRAMTVLQYGMAIMAIVVAVLLTAYR